MNIYMNNLKNKKMNVNQIKGLLAEFWQQTSDACPLECGEAEKQENAFSEFVEGKFKNWQFKDAVSFTMKWVSENEHPHTMVEIESNKAVLWEGKKVHLDDKYIVD